MPDLRAMISPAPRLFHRTDGSRVELSVATLALLLPFRQSGPRDREAGGVLLGRHIRGCRDVVVDEVSAPGPEDWRTRASFHRSRPHHQKVIDEAWRASWGTTNYLGEWHTHPEASPIPSSVDRWDWRRRLKEDTFDADSLLFLIVGIEKIRLWEGSRQTQQFEELREDTEGL